MSPNLHQTASIHNLKDGAITFIRNERYLAILVRCSFNVLVLCPSELKSKVDAIGAEKFGLVKFYFTDYVDYDFALFHNEVNKDREPKPHVISATAKIHPSAIVGVEGLRLGHKPGHRSIQLKHMGNVIMEDGVEMRALATIQTGVLDSTIIHRDVHLDTRTSVGHNCVIGERTAIASGTTIGGSATVGKDCWIGQDCTVKNGVSVCDRVYLGQLTNVVKDIRTSVIYMGNPAEYYKPYDENMNF